MLFTTQNPAAIAGLCIGLGLFAIVVRALANPLKKVPGPWHSTFTRLPLKLAIIRGRRIYYIDALHTKYGPYVRVAPNEIAVSDIEGFSQIHRIGTDFMKSEWYHKFTAQGDKYSLLTMTNAKEHGARRRMFSRPLSHNFLFEHWHGTVKEMTTLAIRSMRDEATSKGKTNALMWFTLMASDVVGSLMQGESFGGLQLGGISELVDIVLERVKIGTIAYEIPIIRSIQHLLEYIRLPRAYIPQIFHSHSDIANVAKFSVESIQNSDHTKNVFSNIAVEAEKGEKLDIPDMVNEAITFIIAGTDTTAVTLTYLLWLVLSRPELQAKLENETGTLPVNFAESDVEKLPLLNAVISETLRLHTPAPGALPRIVPPGGAIMGSIPIPAGTIATTQAYTYHRNATLFPEPYEFLPSRWLNDEVSPEAKKVFHPLGSGSRICVGMHLAYMELRLASAEFFRVCKGACLAASVTDESMEMENHFLMAPRGHKLEIVLPKK
ncbi:Cytochrome P450 monooxygenase [Fulvia fulva]|nr:Cytochrome P450 monooxygenase [Fulvia fulva]WPV16300.1 Cytochrome P450 monooxygenase [Fulvia fulva]